MNGHNSVVSAPANDDPFIRLTIRHDRCTVAVVGEAVLGPEDARMFGPSETAAATEYAHAIAEVLGTRVRYLIVDRGQKRADWLPALGRKETAHG